MFGIEDSKDKLKLLRTDLEKLQQSPLDISLAEKTCTDAWHIADWVYDEMREKDKSLTMELFRESLFSECPEMLVLHDLSNTFKHKKLTRPKANIVEGKVHSGSFSSAFSKAFDVSRLEVHYDEDKRIDVDDLIRIAIKYWEEKLNS